MPMYEYKCGQCGQVFEIIQRFSDEPLTTHEGCGGSVERLISAPAFQFKGSGFYITDYARKSGGANAPASTNASKSESNGGSASDSKPAASTPSSTSTSSSDAKK